MTRTIHLLGCPTVTELKPSRARFCRDDCPSGMNPIPTTTNIDAHLDDIDRETVLRGLHGEEPVS